MVTRVRYVCPESSDKSALTSASSPEFDGEVLLDLNDLLVEGGMVLVAMMIKDGDGWNQTACVVKSFLAFLHLSLLSRGMLWYLVSRP